MGPSLSRMVTIKEKHLPESTLCWGTSAPSVGPSNFLVLPPPKLNSLALVADEPLMGEKSTGDMVVEEVEPALVLCGER